MAKRLDTPYDAWEFNDEEDVAAQILTTLQKQHIQTLMAKDATEKLVMSVEVPGYAYKQEYLRGKVEFASHLLSISDARSALYEAMIEDRRRGEQASKPQVQE